MALALGAVLVAFWMDGDARATGAPQRGRTRERHKFATRRQMCEGSGRSPAGALLYLMPRSLGAACFCSPSVTQCELQGSPY
jgi:hypothetical protein